MASVVLGVIAVLLPRFGATSAVLLILALVAGLAAVVVGVVGFRAAQQMERNKGRALAIGGIIIGAIALLVSIGSLVSPS